LISEIGSCTLFTPNSQSSVVLQQFSLIQRTEAITSYHQLHQPVVNVKAIALKIYGRNFEIACFTALMPRPTGSGADKDADRPIAADRPIIH